MTITDDSPVPASADSRRRPRIVWFFGGLAIIILLVGLSGLSFESKLSDVQKNDNSAFSPGSADSTKVSNASGAFQSIQTIPGNMVFQRSGGLTGADKRFIASRPQAFRTIDNVAADQVGPPTYSTVDPGVAQISVPLVGKKGTVDRTGPELVDAERP